MKLGIVVLASIVTLATLLTSCSSSSTRTVRPTYGVGVGHFYGYGYRPWYPCPGCRPPDIDQPRPELPIEPTPELPIEPPAFEATPLPSMDMNVDFGEW